MADLVTIATTAVLSQFLGPSAKHLGEQALERGKQVAAKATAYLSAVGREPQPVEPKILLPLVQAASLETDSTLADLWAALLANAADSTQRIDVRPAFVEVLRQLSVHDARVLEYIYQKQPPITVYASEQEAPHAMFTSELDLTLGMMPTAVAVSVDNLLRLRLCERPTGGLGGPGPDNPYSKGFRVLPTIFGAEFLRACAPPTP